VGETRVLAAHNAAFDMGHLEAAHLALAGKPLHMSNRWPEHLPGFKPQVEAYFDAATERDGVEFPG